MILYLGARSWPLVGLWTTRSVTSVMALDRCDTCVWPGTTRPSHAFCDWSERVAHLADWKIIAQLEGWEWWFICLAGFTIQLVFRFFFFSFFRLGTFQLMIHLCDSDPWLMWGLSCSPPYSPPWSTNPGRLLDSTEWIFRSHVYNKKKMYTNKNKQTLIW